MTLRVGIVGCGLIGNKRAGLLGDAQLMACADVVFDRASALAARYGAFATNDFTQLVSRNDVDVVMISTLNNMLAPIAIAALDAGKHVLVEKPGAISVNEIDAVIVAQQRSGKLVRVGFNHRYHPALLKAQEMVDGGMLGPMMFVRGRYGHGGRVGYDREWRADAALSGGGELIDQGVHLIDLARRFLGEFTRIEGHAQTSYWDMPVDDNAFLTLQTAAAQTAFLHVSCSEWKNLFSLEIYGRAGKLSIDGLGGSYGVERLTWYRMLPEMGPPETTSWEYPRGDASWLLEVSEFFEDIRLGRTPAASLGDARAALVVVEEIYRRSR
ncbi:MAG: Gfo/Idh/MocA family oxidoreductase [Gemmatimonas sp.]